jgi:hypothetical protein
MNNRPRKNSSRSSMRIRAKWQQHIEAQQASGLTQAAYCREHGLDAQYLSLWKSKLAKRETIATTTAGAARPALIPVIVKTATESVKSAPAIIPSATLSNDVVLKARLPNGIALEFLLHSAQALSSLLTELTQLPC